ncbi:hypothetical protein CLV51_106155 [Chitinophaga niastensis]|uniref:Uncharacterized protein n=1 Tax=Chitinophaga niastensis TaxID=536980 RepID=A0A2P8HDI7_CHINA|nr:hypothetical protein [Chitinophaga niastensis]PSL44289.1 hypothetical protein CLV51_106155 [Chitinophaga niastensis]
MNPFKLPVFLLCLICMFGCQGTKNPPTTLIRKDSVVDVLPVFDGATCLICIDIFSISNKVNTDWAVKANRNPAIPNFNDTLITHAVFAEIDSQKVKCPKGARIKLQFLYHHDPKPIWIRKGTKIVQGPREESDFVDSVLIHLKDPAYGDVAKIYLACCEADSKKSNIDNSLKLDSVTHVITNDHTIHLICGSIEGSEDCDAGGPDKVKIFVYEKKKDTVTKYIPINDVPKDKHFDINTNTVKKK